MSKKLIGWTAATAMLLGGATLGLAPDATASASTTVTIEVKCDDATHLYWREQNTSSWTQLPIDSRQAPVITAPSSVTTTFRFVQYAGSASDVTLKRGVLGTSQALPTSFPLSAGEGQDVYFSKTSASPSWYAGYVKVPPGD